MKLLRYGPSGAERPGMIDAQGNLRDLTGHIDDVTGAVLSAMSLAELIKVDPPACRVYRETRELVPAWGTWASSCALV